MGNTVRLALTAAAAAVTLIAASTPAVAAEEFRRIAEGKSNNIATRGFFKTTGGVRLSYWCAEWATGNLQAQITNPQQTHAYRTFTMRCTGSWVELGSLNVPSNTRMVARVHNYSGGQYLMGVYAEGIGRCYDVPTGWTEPCL